MLVRLPIIPGHNDRDDHFEGVAALLRSLPAAEGVQILSYHRVGIGKAEQLGVDQVTGEKSVPPNQATVENWIDRLSGLSAYFVALDRATQDEIIDRTVMGL